MNDATQQRIQSTIETSPVVLFMKGDRRAPRCGFSARVVEILDSLLPSYETVDVLADPELREGIKQFSSWPTIPQLYVGGEFVGGCDIVTDLFQSGELGDKLGVEATEVAAPKLTVSARAAEALQAALEGDDERVRLEVSPRYEHAMSVGPKQATDLEVDAGDITLLVDRLSAARADGVSIDYVDTPEGPAFKIDNPNEPPRVQQLSVQELDAKRRAGEAIELFDVRTPQERQMASIEGSKLLDEEAAEALLELPRDTELVFFCHTGMRSQQAAEYFLSQGFSRVRNVSGGIEAWSREIDSSVPRY